MSSPNLSTSVCYRDIEGFPGYRIGDDGSILSCWMVGCKAKMTMTWKEMKPTVDRHGRLYATLCARPKRIRRFIHHLVLETFVGPRPPGMEACHDPDRNPANNALSNLRWDTHKANEADKAAHGTRKWGERHGMAKLTEAAVVAIRAEHATRKFTRSELAEKYCVSGNTIGRVVNRETWTHVINASPDGVSEDTRELLGALDVAYRLAYRNGDRRLAGDLRLIMDRLWDGLIGESI